MGTVTYQSTQFRVRYRETDKMGVVYHTNYLDWFEIGRTEMIREAGFAYRTLEEKGIFLPVTNATISYKRPATYDDMVEVRTWIDLLTPLRMDFRYEVYRVSDGELLVFGKTEHIFVNQSFKPIRLTKVYPELYNWLEIRYKQSNPQIETNRT